MLFLHRSERADGLVDMLGDLLVVPVADVMAPEVVAVPTRGIERWLTQQLSTRLGASPGRSDGVCANVEFPFPGTLVGNAIAAGSGIDPQTDPWATDRSVWPLLRVVEQSIDEPWLSTFSAHLRNSAPAGEERRFASVRHVADLFDRYSVHRPQMIRQWAAGTDGGVGSDGGWQPPLWRELRLSIGTPSPAERLPDACASLRRGAEVQGLPERLSLFGLTSLPTSYVEVLDALSYERDVHLFLLHPSAELWERVSVLSGSPKRGTRRRDDPSTGATKNPLLASWGRDSREMQLVLLSEAGGQWSEDHRGVTDDPASVLERVQADVRADRAPGGAPFTGGDDCRPLLAPGDLSIQVHACHGRARQVEVLRHAILHLFEDNPDLEPRDVLVMCPDIETYAPLIHAAFDSYADEHEGDATGAAPPDLRVRLADRAIRQVNPLFGVVSRLLDMAGGRVSATEVLDLAGWPPVRRHFGFDDDDLGRLEDWVVASGIRWGLDSAHRSPFQLGGLDSNTWQAGLRRILLGVAMAEERQRLFGGVLPLDDVPSTDIELAGTLAELVCRIEESIDALSGQRTISEWAGSIAASVDALASVGPGDEWQSAQLARLLADIVEQASTDGEPSQVELGLGDVRAILEDRLRGRPTRANFRTGNLTVCTLVPMRSVPHKVVCLLGLDDGAFPRSPDRDGDDLILAEPQIGDHDARSEDRQLVLDALLAATQFLVITYTGRDERSNLSRPPAVPVGELLDVIDGTVRTADGRTASSSLVVRHPLQPFDPRNFVSGELSGSAPWSFDRANLAGALSAARRDHSIGATRFLPVPLAPVDAQTVDLSELEYFVRFPVRAFLRRRLGISLSSGRDEVVDSLPVELDGLEKWGFGERLLASVIAGGDLDECLAAERARGTLPPGSLSDPIIDSTIPDLIGLVASSSGELPPTSVAVNVTLRSGTTVLGTVPRLRGDVIHRVTFSRMSAGLRIVAWLHLLALSAAMPEREFEAVTFARGRSDPQASTVSVARIATLAGNTETRRDVACRQLDNIVGLYMAAMCEPPPMYCKTSAAWAEAVFRRRSTRAAAEAEWTSDYRFPREDQQEEHILVFGGVARFDEILRSEPHPDESGSGWNDAEPSRFGRWACRLWDGLLEHEKVGTR
jgi:exodeoxyribonuclease V gamma subunit